MFKKSGKIRRNLKKSNLYYSNFFQFFGDFQLFYIIFKKFNFLNNWTLNLKKSGKIGKNL